MRLVTGFSRGNGRGPNLDRWVVTDGWAAVFDGVTPRGTDLDVTTAATVALVDDLVRAVEAAAADLEPLAMVERLTETTAAHQGAQRPSAAAVVFSLTARRVVVVGDGWVGVDGAARFYDHRFESVVTEARRAVTQAALAAGRSVDELRRDDPGRRAVHDLLVGEAELRNVDADGPYFYSCLDGRPVPRRHLAVVDVPAGARSLCLASDGYPVLAETWQESERALFADIEADPLRIGRHAGTKALAPGAETFDDRTFLLLEL
ncbi:hypothetical protein [Nocardioides sp. T2.26MG-1]|uniref:hypothetical protein n=1 Tax=Nocardioides sp. T2.26MG-1 TaxID=3041166 RepID=UPI0024776251|nr:hypothetical protein [Nocardioides sp. T2.26MG-1]CAI9404837.1 hypothetical protein HIDPHFAB_04261 [Nocardioides sp. T2.26MG-1]